jgi:hypothetical protein
MAWSYNASDLNTTAASGRLNSVRLLIGDTDTNDQLVQDEEIFFALGQNGNNVYYAASWSCRIIAAKFSRLVDTQLDGALQASYSDRSKQYTLLSTQMDALGKKVSGRALGVSAGGISNSAMGVVEANTDRVSPQFAVDQFNNPEAADTYIPDYD